MSRRRPQAGVARELVDAIDALVSFVKKNEGRDFFHPEWARDNLHVLGMEVQTLAQELGLASPGDPVYSTAEHYGAYAKLGRGDLYTGAYWYNPTWPGTAYTDRLMLVSPSLMFFLRPSMAWYKRFKTLREKALELCGTCARHGANREDPGLGVNRPDLRVSAAVPKLDYKRARVRVGGRWYDVTDEQKATLSVLFKAKGAWVQGKTLGKRPDKTRQAMPPAVRRLVQSHQRNGYRIPSLLPR